MLDRESPRDALRECRPATENVVAFLWRRLRNSGLDPAISVKVRDPSRGPDLANQVDGIASFLKKRLPDQARPVHSDLETLRSNVHWSYLNTGAHDDERSTEPQLATIRELVELLERIETTVKGQGWPLKSRPTS